MPSPDDRAAPRTGTESRTPDSHEQDLLQDVRDRPILAALGGILLVILLGAAVLVMQELFVALWFLLLLFVVHLALRFVRAVERIASATEAMAEARE